MSRSSGVVMIGRTVGQYHVLRRLGAGGMGVVYEAQDTILERKVALKFLPEELTRNEEARARFIVEARAASRLDHPNICNVHDIGETADGHTYIAMTLYEGETLDRLIEREDRFRFVRQSTSHSSSPAASALHTRRGFSIATSNPPT